MQFVTNNLINNKQQNNNKSEGLNTEHVRMYNKYIRMSPGTDVEVLP